MTFKVALDYLTELMKRGAKPELTPDRTKVFIRGIVLTADEKAWITANRDDMFWACQHLCPHPQFERDKRAGKFTIGAKRESPKQQNYNRGRPQAGQVDTWEEVKQRARDKASLYRPAAPVRHGPDGYPEPSEILGRWRGG